MARNNAMVIKARQLIETHAVGTGIVPRAATGNKELDKALNDLWNEWVSVSDADGQLDFYGQQMLAVGEMYEGGEVFARMRSRRLSDGLPVPMQVQILPTEMVPMGSDTTTDAPYGVVRDAIGRIRWYLMYPFHPYDYDGQYRGSNLPNKVAADRVAHMFHPLRAGQERGLPWISAALTTLFHLDAYLDAEIERKKMAAMVVFWIKKTSGANVDPEELAQVWGEFWQEQGVTPNSENMPSVAVEPGTAQYLDLDESVEMSQPADVGGNFKEFIAVMMRQAAAPLMVIAQELTGDWSDTNDRIFRAQFNTFKRRMQQIQFSIIVHQFCRPIRDEFVRLAVAYGKVRLPAGMTIEQAQKCTWNPQRWEYLHALQDVQAKTAEIEAGLTSREAAVAERGDDIEAVDSQRQRDREREEKMGLTNELQDPDAGGNQDSETEPVRPS